MVAEVLDARVLQPQTSKGEEKPKENLCADRGYTGAGMTMADRGYVAHIRPRGEEAELKKRDPAYKPRRWIVELSHSWLNRFRKLAPRYEKTVASCMGLLELAAAMITLNKVMIIYG